MTLAHRSAAQGVETGNPDLRIVSGRDAAAINAGDVTHSFVTQRLIGGIWQYPRVMNISNAGRVGIGNSLSGGSSSMLSVGMGANKLSIDDAGSPRLNRGAKDYILGSGACIGFNASRQSDAAYACAPGLLDADNANSGSRNGGALIWADVQVGAQFYVPAQQQRQRRGREYNQLLLRQPGASLPRNEG